LEDVRYGGWVDELVLWNVVLVWIPKRKFSRPFLTGTFFCDKTTAQSFPRIPTDMMFAAVIALKAYSIVAIMVSIVDLLHLWTDLGKEFG